MRFRPLRNDGFAQLRDLLRWRVALVLCILIAVLMVVLGTLNTRLGLQDTANLAWVVLGLCLVFLTALLMLPRPLAGQMFYSFGLCLLVGVMAFGLYHERPMHHWAYVFPPLVVFLLGSGWGLVAMLAFGVYVCFTITPLIPGIDVVRFASGYGMLVCFMTTYTLLHERASAMLRYHSDHDALSQCYNRRAFNEALEQLERDPRLPGDCAILMIDIDRFKAINDTRGHLVGDRVIAGVAQALGGPLPPTLALFRFGGEEFSVMLPGVDGTGPRELAESLRAAVAANPVEGERVTVSIGIAHWRRGEEPVARALDRADRALYEAKRAGRNTVQEALSATATASLPLGTAPE
ncbi:GGDEF domain-containing protein [Arenimonas aestuarii]